MAEEHRIKQITCDSQSENLLQKKTATPAYQDPDRTCVAALWMSSYALRLRVDKIDIGGFHLRNLSYLPLSYRLLQLSTISVKIDRRSFVKSQSG